MLKDALTTLFIEKGDVLQLSETEVPVLFHGSDKKVTQLSPVPKGFLERLVAIHLSENQRRTLSEVGQCIGQWQLESFPAVDFVLRWVNSRLVLALRPSASNEETAQSDDPAAETSEALTQRLVDELAQSHDAFDFVGKAVTAGASDIVFSEGRCARVRFGAGFLSIAGQLVSREDLLALLGDAWNERRRTQLDEQGSADLAVELPLNGGHMRFRVNVFQQFDGLAAAWRPIWDEIPKLGSLNLPAELENILQIEQGLVLVTGPTGSGKSTTVAALLDRLNQNSYHHIVTLEDPIEYRFNDACSLVHQREIGTHLQSFSMGLRAALREAPSAIFVGEMRDLETISAALTAAETGHLVVSTLHSGSCIQAIDRMIDVFPEHQQQQVRVQLSDVLRAVVSQRLLPRRNSPVRVPACEILMVNYAVSNLIRERRTHQLKTQLQTGQTYGMLPLEQSLVALLKDGLIEPDIALRAAVDTTPIERYLEDNEHE